MVIQKFLAFLELQEFLGNICPSAHLFYHVYQRKSLDAREFNPADCAK